MIARSTENMQTFKRLIKEWHDSEETWIYCEKLDLEELEQNLKNQQNIHQELLDLKAALYTDESYSNI